MSAAIQLEAPTDVTLDYRTHTDRETCPGLSCANHWHRLDAFLRERCNVCGCPRMYPTRVDRLAEQCAPDRHRFWDAWDRRVKMRKQPSKRAKGPKAKPLDHAQIAHNLLGWYKADGFTLGLEWLVEHRFAGPRGVS